MEHPAARWQQMPLIPGLAPLIQVRFNLNYDGPAGKFGVGYRISELMTDETLAMGATPIAGDLPGALTFATRELAEVHDVAMKFLAPF